MKVPMLQGPVLWPVSAPLMLAWLVWVQGGGQHGREWALWWGDTDVGWGGPELGFEVLARTQSALCAHSFSACPLKKLKENNEQRSREHA